MAEDIRAAHASARQRRTLAGTVRGSSLVLVSNPADPTTAFVTQLDRVLGFYPSGCRFESCRGRLHHSLKPAPLVKRSSRRSPTPQVPVRLWGGAPHRRPNGIGLSLRRRWWEFNSPRRYDASIDYETPSRYSMGMSLPYTPDWTHTSTANGYQIVRCVGHPKAWTKGHYVYVQVVLAEQKLGRLL